MAAHLSSNYQNDFIGLAFYLLATTGYTDRLAIERFHVSNAATKKATSQTPPTTNLASEGIDILWRGKLYLIHLFGTRTLLFETMLIEALKLTLCHATNYVMLHCFFLFHSIAVRFESGRRNFEILRMIRNAQKDASIPAKEFVLNHTVDVGGSRGKIQLIQHNLAFAQFIILTEITVEHSDPQPTHVRHI